ncbi:MAG: hypothetical protein IKK94_01925 [Clostridia bacterium]|nr:hypothetical protein [Clostridia bacterium]
MKKLSVFVLAALLVISLFLCGCDEKDGGQKIIDNKIEADDLFGEVDEAPETTAAPETEAVSSDAGTEAAE